MRNEDDLGSSLPARFEPERQLGCGGMGAVVLAWDRVLCRQVAIKTLTPELAADPVARERFAREAALSGRLGAHPHIATAYEAGEHDGCPYVVFEYMPNGSLAERLRDHGTPPRATALRWLAQAADALDFAHEQKVVHRDVKPSNLLLDANADVSVSDFGVSRKNDEATLTGHGELLGTTGYLAPEQLAGERATEASDRFALAVVAYQLITGSLPTPDGPRPATALAAVFARALAAEPESRYPTAKAFVQALAAAPAEDAAPTLVARTKRRLLPPATTPGARPLAQPPRRSPHKQRSKLGRAALLLVAVLVVAAPATGAGFILARKLNLRVAAPRAHPTHCAVSTFDHDANLVVGGVGAIRFCRSQAVALSQAGDAWGYRANTHLLAPDSGDPSGLGLVCVLARGSLEASVYDDGGRRIGGDLCHSYAASGWQVRSYS